jgi:ADP-ribose pyrophosphatase YjhB (NUDIX family)
MQQYVDTIVINQNNQILLMKRSEHDDFKPGQWTMPGGKYEPENDNGLYFGAMRELAEETSLLVTSKNNNWCITYFNEDNSISHYFIVKLESELHQIVIDYEEHSEFKFVYLNEISTLDLAFPIVANRIQEVLEKQNWEPAALIKGNCEIFTKSQAYDSDLITTGEYLDQTFVKSRIIGDFSSQNENEKFYYICSK